MCVFVWPGRRLPEPRLLPRTGGGREGVFRFPPSADRAVANRTYFWEADLSTSRATAPPQAGGGWEGVSGFLKPPIVRLQTAPTSGEGAAQATSAKVRSMRRK